MEWEIIVAEGFEKRYERFAKKRPHESKAMWNNLGMYVDLLEEGSHPLQIKEGFIHHKVGLGIKEIDQKGCDIPKPMQSRLYVYPDADTKTLHLMTVGNKTDQASDVQLARRYVTNLRKSKEEKHHD